ncbi:MAG TPA: hypothetical protein VGQ22_14280 [Steroidobacteraceae bacterium]|nr:hypothetical protein [Steroidobacteraceae bacterium]
MDTQLPSLARARLAGACMLTAALLSSAAFAGSPDAAKSVQAVWKPVEIKYSYVGFTTAYNCDSFEQKVRSILLRLGAPEQTRVQANGCIDVNRPSRNFFVTINSAAVIPASEAKEPPDKATRELAERLTGKKDPLKTEPFPAQWQTVELARDRRLDLQPGDCELMEGLSKDVLPKLSIKIVSDRVLCTPNNLSITTPELTVSALVPLPKADESSSADRR